MTLMDVLMSAVLATYAFMALNSFLPGSGSGVDS